MKVLVIILGCFSLTMGWFDPVVTHTATACTIFHRLTISTNNPEGVFLTGACRALNMNDSPWTYNIEEDTHYAVEVDTNSVGSYFLWQTIGAVELDQLEWCENDDDSCPLEPDFSVSSINILGVDYVLACSLE